MSNCCHEPETQTDTSTHGDSCHEDKGSFDYFFWCTLGVIVLLYMFSFFSPLPIELAQKNFLLSSLQALSLNVAILLNTIWWGILMGIVMIALLGRVPRDLVMSALGTGRGVVGIMRATAAGVLLDLCSHGILMVGARLYERGASIGQVMAFLIASPWNSFSLTLVLVALVGIPLTLAFIVLSMLIAICTGVLFDVLVNRGRLPPNPNQTPLEMDFRFWSEARKLLSAADYSIASICNMLADGVKSSKMVVRWIFFGVLLASLIQTFVSTEHLAHYFGASVGGLLLTMIAATIIEVCSEGSTPIAADLVTRAGAPGNGFAFLMAGVSTDYTEVMVVKDTTSSWKIALFMPLLTLPQVFVVAWLLN